MDKSRIIMQMLKKDLYRSQPVQVAMAAGDQPDVPDEIQIMPLGEWKVRDMEFTSKEVNEVVSNFNAIAYEPVVDCEHMSVFGWHDFETCGWVKGLMNKGADGLWAKVEWTEYGRQQLVSKRKRYVSPVILFNAQDHRTADKIGAKLHSIALTATPFLEELPAIVNSRDFQINNGDLQMDEFLKKLRAALALDDKSDETAVLNRVAELVNPKPDADVDAVLKALRAQYQLGEDAPAKDIVAAMSKPKTPAPAVDPGNQELETLRAENQQLKLEKFIGRGEAAKKIVNGNKAQWETLYNANPVLAEASLAVAPVVVPDASINSRLNTEGPANETQTVLNKQLGITADDIKTYGRKEAV